MRADGFYPSKKVIQHDGRYVIEMNLWPFVGVLIVLLVVFMMSPPRPMPGMHHVDLAAVNRASRMPLAAREDAIQVSVTRDGQLYFGYNRIPRESLPERIRESVRDGSEKWMLARNTAM
jgi:biopolymer transport protein ExbD